MQDWTGVRLRDLAALAGVPSPRSAFVESLDDGPFGRATLSAGQVLDPDALLALRVNGADLSPGPRLPGAGDRARAARGALHEVGPLDHLPGGVMVTLARRVGASARPARAAGGVPRARRVRRVLPARRPGAAADAGLVRRRGRRARPRAVPALRRGRPGAGRGGPRPGAADQPHPGARAGGRARAADVLARHRAAGRGHAPGGHGPGPGALPRPLARAVGGVVRRVGAGLRARVVLRRFRADRWLGSVAGARCRPASCRRRADLVAVAAAGGLVLAAAVVGRRLLADGANLSCRSRPCWRSGCRTSGRARRSPSSSRWSWWPAAPSGPSGCRGGRCLR